MAKEFFVIKKNRPVQNATKRIKQILDVEYEKINLKSIMMNLNYSNKKHKSSLLDLLQKYEIEFDGILGKCTGSNYTIEQKEDAQPWHAKPIPITKINKPTLKKKIDRFIKIGVLKKIINSQSAAPIIPMINQTARFISDFKDRKK